MLVTIVQRLHRALVNGPPMLGRGFKVVVLIIIIIITEGAHSAPQTL